jgi:aryl-alcohol dehydrogenase-like predicted oxidoreductase
LTDSDAPLGRGFLAGAVRSEAAIGEADLRRGFPRFGEANLGANVSLLDRVERVATERGYASGALALAWVLAQGPDIVAIPGTRRRLHLAANVESAAVQLDEADLRALGAAVPADEVAGARTSPYDIDIEL